MEDKLTKYFSRLLSPEEKDELFRVLDKDDVLKEKFVRERNLFSIIMMQDKGGDNLYANQKYKEFKKKTQRVLLRRISLQALKYAAIILFAIGTWSIYQNYNYSNTIGATQTTIEVPPGQRTHIILPDGTGVWLNAETRLSYPADFSVKNRKVELRGEGFFEVTSDDKNPFIVKTTLMSVTVLGTKFNVKSYDDEDSFVSLMEGKVEIVTSDEANRVTLEPNDHATISLAGEILLSKRLAIENINTWTSGEFNYLNATLIDIAKDLQRRFNVKIKISNEELAYKVFTYSAEEFTTLDQILRHLKATKELDYKRDKDEITIF